MSEVTTRHIYKVLKSRFSGEELRSLCFELEIEYDDLPALAREAKARELVSYMERLGRLDDLVNLIEVYRPQLVWQARSQVDKAEIEQMPGKSPYKGMAFFDEADAQLFFGREALTAELVTRLNQYPFLAIIGASGSGKSSLVRAGLLPALKDIVLPEEGIIRPDGCESWLYRIITPTNRPLETLAECLSNSAKALRDNSRMIADDKQGLHFIARHALKMQGVSHLCLVVDQFEELFTLCRNPKERQAFIDNLLYAVMLDSEGLISLILSLRADFYAHCAQYDNLRQALETDQKYIGAMSQSELKRAIVYPAQQQGWDLEPGLAKMLLQDVGQEPGRLPLLSHALLETWQRREGNKLTFAGYVAAGGLYGAIAQTAETEFNKLNPVQQAIARNIFLRLTELGAGSEDTRRRAPLQELVAQPEQASEVERVLARLATARLITTSEDTAEVVHEALIREWNSLRRWLEEDREGLQIHRRLTEAAVEWEHQERHADYLYRGLPLEEVRHWAEENYFSLNVLENEFLEKSQVARKRRRRQRNAFTITSVVFVILVALVFAFNQSRNASIQSNLAATSNAVATRALYAEGTAQAEAIRANEEANRANTNAAIAATQQALAEEAAIKARVGSARLLAVQGRTVFEEDPLLGLALLIEGWALVREEDETVQSIVLDKVSRQEIIQWGRLAPLGQDIEQVIANRNETRLVVDYFNAPGELRRVEDSSLIETLAGGVDKVTFSSNETWLAVNYAEAPSELRRVEDGSVILILAGRVDTVTFSPNESWLIVDYFNAPGELRMVQDGLLIDILTGGIDDVIFSPNESWLIVDYFNAPGELRRVADGSLIETLAGRIDNINFGPKGGQLVIDYADKPGELRLAADGRLAKALAGRIDTVTFSPNETWLVVDYFNAPGELRRAADGSLIEFLAPGIDAISFNPNETWFIADYFNAPSELRKVEDGSLIETLGGRIDDISFSPNKSWLVVDYFNAPSELRRAADGSLIDILKAGIDNIIFSRNEKWLIVDYLNAHGELRRVTDGSLIETLPGEVNNVTLSPNDTWLVIDYRDAPGELRHAEDSSLLAILAGDVDRITFSTNETWLVLDYLDAPGELRQTADGSVINSLAGDVAQVTFDSNEAWLVADYVDGTAQLWNTSGTRIAYLGVSVQGIVFLPEHDRLVVWYRDGTAYLLDLAWLEAMDGQANSLSPFELVQLACAYPLNNGVLNEAALQGYLNELDIPAPQACQ